MQSRFHRFPLYVLILVTAIAGCGPSQQLYEPPIPRQVPFESTELPLRFDHGYPYVTVLIDSTDCEVYLDTGAAGVALALLPETVESLGLEPTGGTRHLRTNYGEMTYRRSVAPSVSLGYLTWRNVLCDLQDPDIPADRKTRGIMGLALFRPFNVLIDYQAEKLVLYTQDTLDAVTDQAAWMRIPLLDQEDGLHIMGTLPGANTQVKLCLDTGAVGHDQNDRYYNILRPEQLNMFDDIGEMGGMRFVTSRTVTAGDMELTDQNFIGLDFSEPASTDGFLGTDFFMKYRVCVDFANSLLYVQPYE